MTRCGKGQGYRSLSIGRSRLTSAWCPAPRGADADSLPKQPRMRGGWKLKSGQGRAAHIEPVHLSSAFSTPGGTATDAQRGSRRSQRQRAARLRKCLTSQREYCRLLGGRLLRMMCRYHQLYPAPLNQAGLRAQSKPRNWLIIRGPY